MKRNLLLFAVLFLLIQLLYYPMVDGGFVNDFTGLLDRFSKGTASDILTSFGFPALQPVLNFFLYTFYSLFGVWGLAWHLIFSLVFALDCWLVFTLARALCQQFEVKNSLWVGAAAALLFMVSPYQVELLFWKVLFNFLSVIAYLLIGLLLTIRYSKRLERKYLWSIHLMFLLGIFTFELALMAPVFVSAYAVVLYLEYKDQVQVRALFTRIVLPQFAGILGWLALTKVVVGDYIGHYGAETHLKFDFFVVVGTFLKYFFKQFFLLRYWSMNVLPWYTWMEHPAVVLGFLLLLFAVLFLVVKKWKRLLPELKLAVLTFLWAGIGLFPVLNLYFPEMQYLGYDRYGALGWAFFACFLALLTVRFLPRWAFASFFIAYLAVNVYFNQMTVNYVKEATAIHNSLLEDFDYQDRSEVYLLGFAENYYGIYMFSDFSYTNLAFLDPIRYVKGTPVKGTIYDVAQFNMTNPNNPLKTAIDSTGRIHLTFTDWGSWWWRGGIGAGSYETDKLKVEINDLMLYITPKSPAPDAVFLYQDGNRWVALDYPGDGKYVEIRPGPN